jgi:hypothetical protein
MLLLLMSESEPTLAGRRTWWLWFLQGSVGIGGLSAFCRHRLLGWLPVVPLSLIVLSGTPSERISDWARHGWAGKDSDEWTALQAIKEDLPSNGRAETRVGYQIKPWLHMVQFATLDDRYKIGWEWDDALRFDMKVRNLLVCSEGVDESADYLIREKKSPAWFHVKDALKDRIKLLDNDRFEVWR